MGDLTVIHCPVVGTFDHFNGLSSNILLTFSCYFDNPQMPGSRAFEQKRSARFKCPAYARSPPPQRLNIDRCIIDRLVVKITFIAGLVVSITLIDQLWVQLLLVVGWW